MGQNLFNSAFKAIHDIQAGIIRAAKPSEADILTDISFNSKKVWGYPDPYFEIWRKELTITPDYLDENTVFVFEINRLIIGYYSIVALKHDIDTSGIRVEKGHWLEHMFIVSKYLKQGIGTKLFNHLRARCKTNHIHKISLFSDPNAKKFYEKMGCHYIKDSPSTIPGRTTPLYILIL